MAVRVLAVALVLAQAGGAAAFFVAGHWVLGGLLVLGVLATVLLAARISHSTGRTSPPSLPYVETERHFY